MLIIRQKPLPLGMNGKGISLQAEAQFESSGEGSKVNFQRYLGSLDGKSYCHQNLKNIHPRYIQFCIGQVSPLQSQSGDGERVGIAGGECG